MYNTIIRNWPIKFVSLSIEIDKTKTKVGHRKFIYSVGDYLMY